jgi:hypothetical protein
VDLLEKVRQRMQAVPEEGLKLWVIEVERLMGQKFEGELAQAAFHTYLATHLTLAFDDLRWNANSADRLFGRAQSMPAGDAVAWRQAFEKALKKEIGQTADTVLSGGAGYAVPLVLIPIDALYDGQNYNVVRGKRYLARLAQLTPEDVALWKTQVDAYGGTELDAAANLILLDDYFAQEKFQREKLATDIKAKR